MVAPLQGSGIFAITRTKVLLLALLIAWYVSKLLDFISQPESIKSFSQLHEPLLTSLQLVCRPHSPLLPRRNPSPPNCPNRRDPRTHPLHQDLLQSKYGSTNQVQSNETGSSHRRSSTTRTRPSYLTNDRRRPSRLEISFYRVK